MLRLHVSRREMVILRENGQELCVLRVSAVKLEYGCVVTYSSTVPVYRNLRESQSQDNSPPATRAT